MTSNIIVKPNHFIEYGITIQKKALVSKLINQVHGNEIVIIENKEHYETLLKKPIDADGIISYINNKKIFVFTADCLGLLFFADETGPISAIHCGWRGALKKIASKTLAYYEKIKMEPSVVIGPYISKCCYEVKNDFIEAFKNENRVIDNYIDYRDGKVFFDLKKYIIEEELKDLPKNKIIMTLTRCSCCSKPTLPSYRRNGNTDILIKLWITKNL